MLADGLGYRSGRPDGVSAPRLTCAVDPRAHRSAALIAHGPCQPTCIPPGSERCSQWIVAASWGDAIWGDHTYTLLCIGFNPRPWARAVATTAPWTRSAGVLAGVLPAAPTHSMRDARPGCRRLLQNMSVAVGWGLRRSVEPQSVGACRSFFWPEERASRQCMLALMYACMCVACTAGGGRDLLGPALPVWARRFIHPRQVFWGTSRVQMNLRPCPFSPIAALRRPPPSHTLVPSILAGRIRLATNAPIPLNSPTAPCAFLRARVHISGF